MDHNNWTEQYLPLAGVCLLIATADRSFTTQFDIKGLFVSVEYVGTEYVKIHV